MKQRLFVFGTTAELIKLAPVIRLLPHQSYMVLSTEQQALDLNISRNTQNFSIHSLYCGKRTTNLESSVKAGFWFIKTWYLTAKYIKKHGTFSEIVVHGDTFSCLAGTLAAFLLGVPVIHIEAGLRSGNMIRPFPEEIIRRIVDKFSKILIVPTDEIEQRMLQAYPNKTIVNSKGNTVIDNFLQSKKNNHSTHSECGQFGIVSLHRSELLRNRRLMTKTILDLAIKTKPFDMIFIYDSLCERYLKKYQLWELLVGQDHVTLTPKLEHGEFIDLLSQAQFLITDSGGQQEEAAAIGLPCLIYRSETERSDGLGTNAVLGEFKIERLEEFMKSFEKLRIYGKTQNESPAGIVSDFLIRS
jgi:UDP-N-acetylglucosamine 2-epimerase (non-hydrolysing)